MFEPITTIKSLVDIMDKKGFRLFYLSRPGCGVCDAVKVKVKEMLERFPAVKSYYVNLDDLPEAAGQYSLFTIPAILLYIDGREAFREARYISMDILEEKIARPYRLAY